MYQLRLFQQGHIYNFEKISQGERKRELLYNLIYIKYKIYNTMIFL